MPRELMDDIMIPAILHIDKGTLSSYKVGKQEQIRQLLLTHIAHGWAGPKVTKNG